MLRKRGMPAGRYIGMVTDFILVGEEMYGRSPALEYLKQKRHFQDIRVYADEVPLPSPQFCINRAEHTRGTFSSYAWANLSCKRLEQLINSKKT